MILLYCRVAVQLDRTMHKAFHWRPSAVLDRVNDALDNLESVNFQCNGVAMQGFDEDLIFHIDKVLNMLFLCR